MYCSSSEGGISPSFEGSARSRRAAPFRYIFRSEGRVHQLLGELERIQYVHTGGNEHDHSDSDTCLVSQSSTCLDENDKRCTDSMIAYNSLGGSSANSGDDTYDSSTFFQNDDSGCFNLSAQQKRKHPTIDPLCIVPSQKRVKRSEACASSSKPARSTKKTQVKSAVFVEGHSIKQHVNTVSVLDNSTGHPALRCKLTSFSDSAFTHTDTLIGYTPAKGDANIIRTVQNSMKKRDSPDWVYLDQKLKQPHGYSRDRYTSVLRKYVEYDTAITTAVLSAQANNKLVLWPLLDEQYPLGHSEARWGKVLMHHCDGNGITSNGKLRPELYSRYRDQTTVKAGSSTVHNSISATVDPTPRSRIVINTVAAILPLSNDNIRGPNLIKVPLDEAQPFDAEADAQLLWAVDLSKKSNSYRSISWHMVSRRMHRSLPNLKLRYAQLLDEQEIARRQQHLDQCESLFNLANGKDTNSNGYVTDQSLLTNAHATTYNTSDFVNKKLINDSSSNTTPHLPTRIPSINSIEHPPTSLHTRVYTPTEDSLIQARVPLSLHTLEGDVGKQFPALAYELRRSVESIKHRWQELRDVELNATYSNINSTEVGGDECDLVPSASAVTAFNRIVPEQAVPEKAYIPKSTHSTKTRPFSVAEDELIVERVPLSRFVRSDFFLGFVPLSLELNRPMDLVKNRWIVLYNALRRPNMINKSDNVCTGTQPVTSTPASKNMANSAGLDTASLSCLSTVPAVVSPSCNDADANVFVANLPTLGTSIIPNTRDTDGIAISDAASTAQPHYHKHYAGSSATCVVNSGTSSASYTEQDITDNSEKAAAGTCALALTPLQVEEQVSPEMKNNIFVDAFVESYCDNYW